MSKELFEQFRVNLAVKNADEISRSYKQVTRKLNEKYYGIDSESGHCRQVGSYGRHTAVHGVSDLDMAFELPWEVYERFNKYESNRQSSLLAEIRLALKDRFPNREVRAQQQIVSIDFNGYIVEVLPAFVNSNGSYTYPDANNGGSWEVCNPVAEIHEINDLHKSKGKNLKPLCKMVRAWKNDHGVPIKGMLIDTLCYQFLKGTSKYDTATFADYGELTKDFFAYIVSIDYEKEAWRAPGSGSIIKKSGNFHPKAKKALRRLQEALEDPECAHERWRTVFGEHFPDYIEEERKAALDRNDIQDLEEFIGRKFSLDIQYSMEIDCKIRDQGVQLRNLMSRIGITKIPKQKHLDFYVSSIDVPKPYKLYWKVRNVGSQAIKKNMLRGQIKADNGSHSLSEYASFDGDHFVECFAIKDNVCVARGRIVVPI
ncbi:nucleotidyltransferase [Pseudomonas sp. DP-17]|uniref:SMODS domain-containing nucleotidyltransferase n=1 Tax=Pseudomonas sp. DP-17 TaxID=1580486 RepID=UPI001EFB89D4|nr:nucleotidyltransferase [Pseudomonas sp. DP-17]MCG8905602.1 nucleotidyltransferase [Pseudomonas sp. DP-17]